MLPVSAVLKGEYGLEDVALSIPSIVGKDGLEKILEIPLGREERAALEHSAAQLKQAAVKLERS